MEPTDHNRAACAQKHADRHPDGSPNSSLDSDFDAARPKTEIAQRKMRANLRANLFGAPSDPVRLGRFVILERLGQGGMGVVYSAYDPNLDRRVAVKLLRRGMGQRSAQAVERLRREAQALAQLSHPNVVPVHDVGVIDEQVFIVMEFVVGVSLADWAKRDQPSWRDILAAYRQAGLGLAAAHDVGLVHRDFKPENVQRGEDGRIRVLDFGLARSHDAADDVDQTAENHAPLTELSSEPSAATYGGIEAMIDTASIPDAPVDKPSPSARTDTDDSYNKLLYTPLTATGTLLGTPAYMSPEQYKRLVAGPASDQFSFCVSLYEGLYGQRPFSGDNLLDLRDNVLGGAIRPPPPSSRAPRFIYAILRRGMSVAPGDRFASMNEMLDQLARDPARTRRRWLIGLLIVLLLATTGYSLARSKRAVDVCQGAAEELANTWNLAHRNAIEDAFSSTSMPYAEPAWQRVASGLERYANKWITMHESACRAHQRGEQSGRLLDRRMACLAERRMALTGTISVLSEIDATSLKNAVDVVHELPTIVDCADVEALSADVSLPDRSIEPLVRDIRTRMSRAVALEHAARYSTAADLIDTLIAETIPTDYRPLLAELSLLKGRLDIAMGNAEQAVAPLRRAATLGLATNMNRVGLEALSRYVYAQGTSSASEEDGLGALFIAEALIEKMSNATFVHALLLNNAGVVYMARGERERAAAYYERALEVKNATTTDTPIELTAILHNLALVTPDPQRRAALMNSAGSELERELGAVHPKTLESRLIQSYSTFDLQRAQQLLQRTCDSYRQFHPERTSALASCVYYLGFVQMEMGNLTAARSSFAEAAERFPKQPATWLPDLARGYSLMLAGQCTSATVALDAALARLQTASDRWWNNKRSAEAAYAKGMCLVTSGRIASAIEALERANRTFMAVASFSRNADTGLRLARTRISLATALWPETAAFTPAPLTSDTRSRARSLVAHAETWYRRAGSGYQQQLDEIARWRQQRNIGR